MKTCKIRSSKLIEQQLQAAEKGNTSAQFNLGIMYFSGQGVEQDYAKSADWLEKAANLGHATAQSNLGFCIKTVKAVNRITTKPGIGMKNLPNKAHHKAS